MIKLLSKNLFYIYIVLWILYRLQTFLGLKGIIAQSILGVFLLISIYALFRVNLYYKHGMFITWLNIILIIVTIYGLVPIIGDYSFHKKNSLSLVVDNYYYLQMIYLHVLPIYVFYYYTLKGRISPNCLTYILLTLFICSVAMYFQNYILRSAENDKEEIVNNVGYQFVPLILLLYLVKMKDAWKYIFLVASFLFILMSMKRGAILVGSFAFLSYIVFQWKGVSAKQLVSLISLTSAVIYSVFLLITKLYSTSPYFQFRLRHTMEGDSSGRDKIYQHYINYFIEKSSPTEFLFGQGAAGTIKQFGEWAHNDWIEFAIDLGMLGVILYLFYWIVFVIEWRSFMGNSYEKRALRDCIIVYFLVALFSMSFNGMPLAASLCIGYCLAVNVINKAKIECCH